MSPAYAIIFIQGENMNILKYIAYTFKAETPQLRAEAAAAAKNWVNENMPNTYKFEDIYRINYQAYMRAYINSYIATSYKNQK
jgi:hypothetical protein